MKLRRVRFFRVVLFLSVLCLLTGLANYCLYNDNRYTRVMFHEMYMSEQMDVVFIGSSNVYRHFDTEIWDESLALQTFNLGTSAQTPDAAYYIMKEVFKDKKPRYCIYGINSILFLKMDIYDNPQNHYIIFDYLKPSFDKCMYGYAVFHDKSLLNACIPFTRNANADLMATGKEVLGIKGRSVYQNYGYQVYGMSDTEEYRGKGFVYSQRQTQEGEVGEPGGYLFSDYDVNEKYIDYMKKLKKLCDSNGCELIFMVPPLPYASMKVQGDYQRILDFYENTAESLGVTLFNFDLSRPEYLLMEDEDFYDYAHMSGKGAQKFSRTAAKLVKRYIDGEKIEKSKYFYSSYEELLNHSPWIFNAWIERTGDDYTAYSFYGNGIEPEYCFWWSGDEGHTWEILRGYSRNNRITGNSLPEHCGMLMVGVKPEGENPEELNYQQCDRIKVE